MSARTRYTFQIYTRHHVTLLLGKLLLMATAEGLSRTGRKLETITSVYRPTPGLLPVTYILRHVPLIWACAARAGGSGNRHHNFAPTTNNKDFGSQQRCSASISLTRTTLMHKHISFFLLFREWSNFPRMPFCFCRRTNGARVMHRARCWLTVTPDEIRTNLCLITRLAWITEHRKTEITAWMSSRVRLVWQVTVNLVTMCANSKLTVSATVQSPYVLETRLLAAN